ncbi:hypothetical protein [Aequorivita capsosiphonis]|uniref:hypothetical protein n=1 Tax=Aequorivita capsosiphonis TaxID=487317 RepID=UPI00041F6613|nr:hypothetical protein [Aequorivita capsosiphonis]
MKYRFTLLILLITFSSQFCLAQHIRIDKKELVFLAEQQKVNVLFTFDSLTFDGKNIPEVEFLQNRYVEVSEWKDKQAAKEWLVLYDEYKNNQWQEAFINTLNERTAKYDNTPVFNRNDSTAKYTIQVNSDWMYFGYNVIVGKQPSKVSMTLSFYETANPSNILFATDISRAMGTNNESYNLKDWPSFRRMEKAYIKAGYKFAQALKRVLD